MRPARHGAAMTVRRRLMRWLRIPPLLAVLTLACATGAWAAASSPDADRDELGQCKRGYYALGQTCIPLEMPENARLDSTGHAWVCRSGFYQSGTQCLPVKMPAHAKLDSTGHEWVCEKGFYRVGEQCEIVCGRGFHNVGQKCVPAPKPSHTPAVSGAARGDAAECPAGTRGNNGQCERLRPPAHASLDKSGHDWACDAGFFRYGEECRRVCDKGFVRDANDSCRPVVVPSNATLDKSGHNWTCNLGFIAQDNACVPVPLDTAPPRKFGSGGAKEKAP